MNILFTGGSSLAGSKVLKKLVEQPEINKIWCIENKSKIPFNDPKIKIIKKNFFHKFDLKEIDCKIDLIIHFAALSHSTNISNYWKINYEGTLQLIKLSKGLGCKRFAYISTRCALKGAGAYGESKLAAEEALRSVTWESLLIIRPSEMYGLNSKEGVDKFIRLASQFHIVPWICGDSNIRFAPIHFQDFVDLTIGLIKNHKSGEKIINMFGPETFNGFTLAKRISKKYRALMIPVYIPFLKLFLKLCKNLNFYPIAPDQISRMICDKSATFNQSLLSGKPVRPFLIINESLT